MEGNDTGRDLIDSSFALSHSEARCREYISSLPAPQGRNWNAQGEHRVEISRKAKIYGGAACQAIYLQNHPMPPKPQGVVQTWHIQVD